MTSQPATRPVKITAPEPDLTTKEVIARAEALRHELREEQAATEERTHYSEAMHEAFDRAGFYRILQPRMFGGYEFDVATFYKVIIEISRGCPSTGWCLSLASAHSLQAGSYFDERAQSEMFGPDGDFRAATRDTPRGTAKKVDGGYLVNGTWDYCSGIPWSNHFMAGAMVEAGEDGTIEFDQFSGRQLLLVLRSDQWEQLHDWGNMLGLRGSGSHSVKVEEAFVPDHMLHRLNLLDVDVSKGTLGGDLHGNPMYAGRQFGFFGAELASIAVGTAKAMLDEYEHIITTRKTTFSPHVLRAKNHNYQRAFGLSMGMVDSAEAIVLQVGANYMEYCRAAAAGEREFTLEMDYRLDQMASQAGNLAWQAADLLVRTAGSSPMANGARLQRYLRDLIQYRTHMVGSQWELMATTAAELHLEPLIG